MRENRELRAIARSQLQGTWIPAILVTLIYCVIIGASSFVIVGPLVLGGPLTLGLYGYYMNKARNKSVSLENLFDVFKDVQKDGIKEILPSILLYLLVTIFITLWSLLLIVPGIIKGLSYSMSFFILRDNPKLDAMSAINQSKQMMNGYKWKLFLLCLSFLGWGLLCILTFGIGFLWLIPYMLSSFANFYEDLKK